MAAFERFFAGGQVLHQPVSGNKVAVPAGRSCRTAELSNSADRLKYTSQHSQSPPSFSNVIRQLNLAVAQIYESL